MTPSAHLILLGDSILDNAAYVRPGWAVIKLLEAQLPRGWRSTLLAVDGSVCADVAGQLTRLPPDATHLVVSCGGNDALLVADVTAWPVASVGEALSMLADIRERFRADYRRMLAALRATGLPSTVCTIYNAVPGLAPELETALALFNDVILFEAARVGLPVIDLRLICADKGDYSSLSPIEPSEAGGAKISAAILRQLPPG